MSAEARVRLAQGCGHADSPYVFFRQLGAFSTGEFGRASKRGANIYFAVQILPSALSHT